MTDTQTQLDGTVADLEEIEERLRALPEDDYNGRIDLRERRLALLAEAGRLRKELPVDREALEAELAELRERADELRKRRIDPVKQAGGGSSGGDFGFAADAWRLNRHIDAASGIDGILARISEIEEILDRQ